MPADGRGAGPPLSRHPLPACQPEGAEGDEAAGQRGQGARADPGLARDLPRHRHPLDLHRRLSRRDRRGFRLSAAMARRGPARPRRRLQVRAGRAARRRTTCPASSRRRSRKSATPASWRRPPPSPPPSWPRRSAGRSTSSSTPSIRKAAPPAAQRPTRRRSTARSISATPGIWRRATSSAVLVEDADEHDLYGVPLPRIAAARRSRRRLSNVSRCRLCRPSARRRSRRAGRRQCHRGTQRRVWCSLRRVAGRPP